MSISFLYAFREELQAGRLQHLQQLTAFDENRVVLTQRNLIAELFKFSMRSLFPCVVPIRYVALYAMQSGNYIPSPEWLKRFSKMDHHEAQSLWEIVHTPKNTVLSNIDCIFFENRSLINNSKGRYFLSGPLSVAPPDVATAEEDESETGVHKPKRSTSDLIRLIRSRKPHIARTPVLLTDEFIPFADAVAEGDGPAGIFSCPDTLEEMLYFVRQHREKRIDIVDDQRLLATATFRNMEAQSMGHGYRVGR